MSETSTPRCVVIAGANGQVGQELQRLDWPQNWTIHALGSSELDITDAASVKSLLAELAPDVIVNAAAYTAVDAAEDDEERATAVNAAGVQALVEAAKAAKAFLVHISTDYVFDGTKDGWYNETDSLSPIGAYGRSKAQGEAVAQSYGDSVTFRTAWVYGALGSNFVTTMLRLAAERDELGVVHDQVGCPTSAADIADAISQVIDIRLTSGALPSDLYHLVAPDSASWFEVAQAVFELSEAGFGGTLNQLSTDQYPTKAKRPQNSKLASAKLSEELRITLPPWRQSLQRVVKELEGTR